MLKWNDSHSSIDHIIDQTTLKPQIPLYVNYLIFVFLYHGIDIEAFADTISENIVVVEGFQKNQRKQDTLKDYKRNFIN